MISVQVLEHFSVFCFEKSIIPTVNQTHIYQKTMTDTFSTGATFITTGVVTGAGISASVGGMGLAGGFGAVGIGTIAVVGAGAVAGATVYGAFKAIEEGDTAAFTSAGIGAVGGAIG
ncbi:MAG: hypothetical protein QNJ47_16410 [Nostocaceae cyanobacterium]|nr:hypothetical protein [Nostocaceae cyanobacterium]